MLSTSSCCMYILPAVCPGGQDPGPNDQGHGRGQQQQQQQQYGGGRPSSATHGPPPGMGGNTFVPGKIFIGGLANTTTKEMLESYCAQWCASQYCHTSDTAPMACLWSTSVTACPNGCRLLEVQRQEAEHTIAPESVIFQSQGWDVGHRADGGPRLWLCDIHRPPLRPVLPRGEPVNQQRLQREL